MPHRDRGFLLVGGADVRRGRRQGHECAVIDDLVGTRLAPADEHLVAGPKTAAMNSNLRAALDGAERRFKTRRVRLAHVGVPVRDADKPRLAREVQAALHLDVNRLWRVNRWDDRVEVRLAAAPGDCAFLFAEENPRVVREPNALQINLPAADQRSAIRRHGQQLQRANLRR